MKLSIISITIFLLLLPVLLLKAEEQATKSGEKTDSKLLIIWTSGDRDVALKMVFMYTLNAKKHAWFDEVTLLIWGPSAKLLTEDEELQKAIKTMTENGVKLLACKACSDSYGISDKLKGSGVEVIYVGSKLSDMLKAGWITLSF